jgi:hypothetical protein
MNNGPVVLLDGQLSWYFLFRKCQSVGLLHGYVYTVYVVMGDFFYQVSFHSTFTVVTVFMYCFLVFKMCYSFLLSL